MNWIDLQTGYMVGAFKNMAEMEEAKRQMEAEGRKVVYAQHRLEVQECDAQWWVLKSLDNPDRFLNYTFSPARRSCLMAKESLDTAVELLYGQAEAAFMYLVIVKL
jgi:hypothetical protein